MTTIIIIPARMGALRLPNKPLALIGDKPMILRVAEQAKQADIGKVVIACDGEEISRVANVHGFDSVITSPDLASGTDRVFAAIANNYTAFDCIINLQGDMPFIDPEVIIRTHECFKRSTSYDIATAVAKIRSEDDYHNPSVVKAILSPASGRALYFSRSPCPSGGIENAYKHIGIYAYKPSSLQKFVTLPPSPLEQSEKLEQLRAMENGMNIVTALVEHYPISVDTPEDLEAARNYYNSR